jgi:hypothetical protein
MAKRGGKALYRVTWPRNTSQEKGGPISSVVLSVIVRTYVVSEGSHFGASGSRN